MKTLIQNSPINISPLRLVAISGVLGLALISNGIAAESPAKSEAIKTVPAEPLPSKDPAVQEGGAVEPAASTNLNKLTGKQVLQETLKSKLGSLLGNVLDRVEERVKAKLEPSDVRAARTRIAGSEAQPLKSLPRPSEDNSPALSPNDAPPADSANPGTEPTNSAPRTTAPAGVGSAPSGSTTETGSTNITVTPAAKSIPGKESRSDRPQLPLLLRPAMPPAPNPQLHTNFPNSRPPRHAPQTTADVATSPQRPTNAPPQPSSGTKPPPTTPNVTHNRPR